MPSYPDVSVPAAFHDAFLTFAGLVDHLDGAETRAADHATVERRIAKDGTELLRQMFQAWITVRASSEPQRDVVGFDEVRRTHHRAAVRPIESVFGEVQVKRDQVGARGHSALVPLDAGLNLPDGRFTFGVRERVVEEAISGSYDGAVETIRETTGASVAKRQAEELVVAAAVDFDAFYAASAVHAATDSTDLLVLTADGKGIVMRPDGLRAGWRLARTSSRSDCRRGRRRIGSVWPR